MVGNYDKPRVEKVKPLQLPNVHNPIWRGGRVRCGHLPTLEEPVALLPRDIGHWLKVCLQEV